LYDDDDDMLTEAEVERIALLGRLALTDEEKARYARQLSAVLDYAAQLATLDVEGIPPTATVIPIRSVMREGDEVFGSLPRADALANAPSTDGASFVVQATLDND
jgi:aspartyl-tRNA(Asn)/glutamyl-tRNA(Gln) amidotransferase subunit C